MRFISVAMPLLVFTECAMAKQEAKRALKRAADGSGELQRLDSGARTNSEETLPREEVVRRLRLLGQPATLFGEVMSACSAVCQPHAFAHV